MVIKRPRNCAVQGSPETKVEISATRLESHCGSQLIVETVQQGAPRPYPAESKGRFASSAEALTMERPLE